MELDFYYSNLSRVNGWVMDGTKQMLMASQSYHKLKSAKGDAVEIGVFEAKFLIAISHILNNSERILGIDLFESASQCQDKFLSENYTTCLDNLTMQTALNNFQTFGNKEVELKLLQKHSVIDFEDIKKFFRENHYSARIISVDGGHDFDSVYSDIMLADIVGTDEAHLYLDDIFNPQWPGVIEATIAHLKDKKTNWAPVCISSNKMVLCRNKMHAEFLNFYKNYFATVNVRKDKVNLCGWELLSF